MINEKNLLTSFVEDSRSLLIRLGWLEKKTQRHSPPSTVSCLVVVVLLFAFTVPIAEAGKQSSDSVQAVQDPDRDGLESRLEVELGTNPRSSDTDGDGLSDYDEYCKYRTDPTKKDSDGDGKPDGDWDERREYTYTIRAICEIRPPSSMEMINDLYQDARPFEKVAALKDARVVEVLIFPFAEAHVYSQPYPNENLDKKLKEYIQPTVSMNYSPEMKEQIDNIVEGSASDVAAIEKMLQWLNHETRLVRELPHWEYFHIIDDKIVWHKSLGSPARDEQFLETNFLGDSMFKNKVHGTCSSTAILRGTMFRAAGLPTRLIQTLPLMTRYSEDPEPLADRLRMREVAKGYAWGPGNGGANHTYNEVFLNHRWVRVDNSIGTGPFVGDKLFVKAWSSANWNNLKEEWNDKRCFRALDVSDARPKYKDKSGGTVDIVVEDSGLIIEENPNGSFDTVILIHNRGSAPSPQFRVNFYAGDPDEGGRLLSEHNSGPIMPRSTWGERDPGLILKPGENTITVVVDPDNKVAESDETNNKASQVIPGRQSKYKTESTKIDIAIEDKDLTVTKQPDGSFRAEIAIWNKGSRPLPEFGVYFYAGDPDKGGRLLATHAAGPIMPGDGWGEYNPGLKLKPGENTISVVVDPGNKVEESDETNNKASQTISTTAKVKHAESTESIKVDIAIEDKDLKVTKLSDKLFEAVIDIYNKGSMPLPRFSVYFYAGDPDKGGRLLSHPSQSAGPIMPGGRWLEGIHPQRLKPGEDTVSVVLDPDNKVEESDETNNKASQTLSKIVSESEKVDKVGTIQKLDLSGDDILQVEAQASEDFNFPYYLFIPSGIDKDRKVYMLVETNNTGMVSDDLEVHRVRALMLVKKSHANRMARRLGVPLLVPTFPRPRTNWLTYTHALDIDTLEIEEGKLKRIDLQLTSMIKYAQELLRVNGFTIDDKIFMHGFSASAKFCNRYSYLHPEMVKAAAAGGVNGLPTLPVREWNGYELPFPIGTAGIERFIGKPFDEKAFMQVAHYIYMGSSDRNDTLLSREAWREEEADIIRKALAAEKMMPDRWELSRKIYHQQKLPSQLVTYNGVGHSIKGEMLDDVIDFFNANSEEKFVRIKPYEYPFVKSKESRPKYKSESAKIDIAIEDKNLTVTKQPDGTFRVRIAIYNKGSNPLPQFGVYFYAGDPDKGGRLLATHAAGPIMPGDVWGEYNPSLKLRPGENTISVVVDPDKKVEETDETNNKASQTISTTVDKDNSQPSDRLSTLVSKAPQLQRRTSEFVAILSNSVTVELVGVCEHPSEGKQWWRPDGSLIDKAPYKTTGSKLKKEEGYNYYEFVVRLKGPSGTSYKWHVPGSRHGSSTGAPTDEYGDHVSDLRVYTANQPEQKTTALVRIGLSTDKWKTLVSHPVNIPEETYTLEDGKNAVAFGRSYEKEDQTIVPLIHTLNRGVEKKALRLIAVTKSDDEVHGSSSGRGGNILISNTYGFDLSLESIKEFRFQTRSYQWVEFKNVSLRPGHKADVQF